MAEVKYFHHPLIGCYTKKKPTFYGVSCVCLCNTLQILLLSESELDALDDILGNMSGLLNFSETYI